MIILAVLLALAYLASAVASGAWWDIPATELLDQGASFAPAIAGGESWRLVSAIFLHGGLLHLLFNGFALIEIGRLLERRIGPVQAIGIFLLAGAWGFFASLLWQPAGISVGASGGIFGLLGSWAMLAIRDIGEDAEASTRNRRRVSVVLALLLAFGFGFLLPNVDHAAHFGGLAVGMLLGGCLGEQKWHRPIFFATAFALGGGLYLATLQLPASWQIEYDETHEYAQRYRHFAEEDRQVSAALAAIGEASRRNQISDAEGLARLDQELLPRLARSASGLRDRRWQTARIAEDATRWTAYAELRLAAVTALRDAIAATDPEQGQRELKRFERLMVEAAQLAHQPAPQAKPPPGAAPR